MGALELGMLAGDASALPPRRRRSLVAAPPLRDHCRRTPLAVMSLSTFSGAARTSLPPARDAIKKVACMLLKSGCCFVQTFI